MRLLVVGAMMAIAMPAAGGQFIEFEGVKGETGRAACAAPKGDIAASTKSGQGFKTAKLTPRKGGSDGEAIQGSLDRDIIRRIPSGPKPKPQEARGGVQVAVGDINGDGRTDGKVSKVDSFALKQGAAEGC